MSTFEDGRYRWRETYFVLFRAANRPMLNTVEKTLTALNKRYQLSNPGADKQGRFESLTLVSPDDFAAMDICYTSGAEVLDQGGELAEELKANLEPEQRGVLKKLRQCEARFDVLHFEQVLDTGDDEEEDEMLDPGALLAVMEALAALTEGIAVDPQSGTVLNEES